MIETSMAVYRDIVETLTAEGYDNDSVIDTIVCNMVGSVENTANNIANDYDLDREAVQALVDNTVYQYIRDRESERAAAIEQILANLCHDDNPAQAIALAQAQEKNIAI